MSLDQHLDDMDSLPFPLSEAGVAIARWAYRCGVKDRTATIIEMVKECEVRDPTLQKLRQAIEEL